MRWLAFGLFATAALAQSWPARQVRVIVPFPPGGGLDFFARTTVPRLREFLGQQIVVENRSGAGGMVGADAVAKAAPDGYTLLLASSAEVKARLLEQGVESVGTTPDQLAKFMVSESARYGKIIRDTGAKPD